MLFLFFLKGIQRQEFQRPTIGNAHSWMSSCWERILSLEQDVWYLLLLFLSLSLSCCLLELLTTTKFQSRFSLIVSNSTLMYKYLCSYCCKCSSSKIHPFWTFSSTILSNFIFQPTTRKMALPVDSFATNHVFIMAWHKLRIGALWLILATTE